MFDIAARAATPDALLIFWTTATLAAYVLGLPVLVEGQQAERESLDWMVPFQTWRTAILIYTCMGMAALAKGPIGILLPTAIIGLHQLILRRSSATGSASPNRVEATGSWARVRHWGKSAGLTLGSTELHSHVLEHASVDCDRRGADRGTAVVLDGCGADGRCVDSGIPARPQRGPRHPVLGRPQRFGTPFYPVALLVGFFPWSVFAVPVIWSTTRQWGESAGHRHALVLVLCWMTVFIGLFSLARTKLPSYITPCYPAVALLVGNFVVAWVRDQRTVPQFWTRAAMVCLGIVGLGILIGVPIAAAQFLPGEQWLAVLGLIPLVVAGLGLFGMQRGQTMRSASSFAVGAVLLTTAMFAWGARESTLTDNSTPWSKWFDLIRERSRSAQWESPNPVGSTTWVIHWITFRLLLSPLPHPAEVTV